MGEISLRRNVALSCLTELKSKTQKDQFAKFWQMYTPVEGSLQSRQVMTIISESFLVPLLQSLPPYLPRLSPLFPSIIPRQTMIWYLLTIDWSAFLRTLYTRNQTVYTLFFSSASFTQCSDSEIQLCCCLPFTVHWYSTREQKLRDRQSPSIIWADVLSEHVNV